MKIYFVFAQTLVFFSLNTQIPDVVAWEEEVYEDEDDENAETNWRNDYPDESSEGDSDTEERYGGHTPKLLHLLNF